MAQRVEERVVQPLGPPRRRLWRCVSKSTAWILGGTIATYWDLRRRRLLASSASSGGRVLAGRVRRINAANESVARGELAEHVVHRALVDDA